MALKKKKLATLFLAYYYTGILTVRTKPLETPNSQTFDCQSQMYAERNKKFQ